MGFVLVLGLLVCFNEFLRYVYDEDTIVQSVTQLRSNVSTAISRLFYAVKANPNGEVIKCLEKQGVGFECVSPEEVKHVLSLLPGLDHRRILFTPNFAPKSDYVYAFSVDCWVNQECFCL